MSGPDIFISYSREDRDAARHFAQSFEQQGLKVWWDAALHSGETFDEVIEGQLRASKAVVVLWSPRSVASRWVRAEATLADRRNKLVPVIIEPCDRPIIFELTHTADLSRWDGGTDHPLWLGFMRDLKRLIDRETETAIPVAPTGIEPPPLSVKARFGPKPAASVPSESVPRDRMDDLMFALSNLQNVISQSKSKPEIAVDDDPSDRTQFSTRAGTFALFGADQFHCLEVMDGDQIDKRYVVSPLGLKIGRTPPADIVLADARVSRAHCFVELADERLRVSDLNSTNGTFIDGERVIGEAMLGQGSVLRIGNVAFRHEIRPRAEVGPA